MNTKDHTDSAPSELLRKGANFWRESRIWAPLPASHATLPTPIEPTAPTFDLSSPALGVEGLDSACSALSPRIANGMALRALGGEPGDRAALLAHWLSLGPEGIRTRFFYHVPEELLRRRAASLDFSNPRFAGVFDSDGTLACVAEWAFPDEAASVEAEAAFSTSPAHRRKGYAKIAAAACALDARAKGVTSLRIDTLWENRAAQALAASLGGARPSGEPHWDDCASSFIDLTATGAQSIESRMGLSIPQQKNLR